MRFLVTARSSTGDIVCEHTLFLDALTQDMSLSVSGMTEVRIADGNGPARSPADLYRSMFGALVGKSAPTVKGSSAALPLAA